MAAGSDGGFFKTQSGVAQRGTARDMSSGRDGRLTNCCSEAGDAAFRLLLLVVGGGPATKCAPCSASMLRRRWQKRCSLFCGVRGTTAIEASGRDEGKESTDRVVSKDPIEQPLPLAPLPLLCLYCTGICAVLGYDSILSWGLLENEDVPTLVHPFQSPSLLRSWHTVRGSGAVSRNRGPESGPRTCILRSDGLESAGGVRPCPIESLTSSVLRPSAYGRPRHTPGTCGKDGLCR